MPCRYSRTVYRGQKSSAHSKLLCSRYPPRKVYRLRQEADSRRSSTRRRLPASCKKRSTNQARKGFERRLIDKNGGGISPSVKKPWILPFNSSPISFLLYRRWPSTVYGRRQFHCTGVHWRSAPTVNGPVYACFTSATAASSVSGSKSVSFGFKALRVTEANGKKATPLCASRFLKSATALLFPARIAVPNRV